MPLTPEDVANKRFPTSRFRAGYEPESVDQFLDEVEQEIYRLLRENEDLRGRLTSAQRSLSEAEARAADAETRAGEAERRAGEAQRRLAALEARAADAEARAAQAEAQAHEARASLADMQSRLEETESRLVEAEARAAQAELQLTGEQTFPEAGPSEAVPISEGGEAGQAAGSPEAATGLLALAQRTADEYVSSARAEADRIVAEARAEADRIVAEAEERRRSVLGSLERDQAETQRRVDELKTFEREYRARLREYLAGQLAELDRMPTTDGLSSSGGAGG